jgi:hypothetical protein
MTSEPAGERPIIIDGRVSRRTSNALTITFTEGTDEPIATAQQGSEDGRGKKLGVLFGFKNGGPGQHGLTFADGHKLTVHSREQQPTSISDDSREIAVVNRVSKGGPDVSTALADGRPLLTFASDPDEPVTAEVFRAKIADGSGVDIGWVNVVRKTSGWASFSDVLLASWDLDYYINRTGKALPILILGTRLMLTRVPSPLERDVLLATCVDMALGIRPYIPEMN